MHVTQDELGNPIAGPEFSAELAAELDQYGAAVGAPGQWASCVRLVDPAGTAWGTDGQGSQGSIVPNTSAFTSLTCRVNHGLDHVQTLLICLLLPFHILSASRVNRNPQPLTTPPNPCPPQTPTQS